MTGESAECQARIAPGSKGRRRGLALRLLVLIAIPCLAGAQTRLLLDERLPGVASRAILDGDDGAIDGVFVVDEVHGFRPGGASGPNRFHSFDDFDVGVGDAVRIRADLPTENVVVGVWESPSQIDGLLGLDASSGSGAPTNLLFLNPLGVLFGPEGSLDVPGAFHVSTGEALELGGDRRFSAAGLSGASLLEATPTAFGFLGAPVGGITVEGLLEVERGRSLGLVGSGITVDGSSGGGLVSAPDGEVMLVSVGGLAAGVSEARVDLSPSPEGGVVLSGFEARGEVRLVDGAIVSASGISPTFPSRLQAPDGSPIDLTGAFEGCAPSGCLGGVSVARGGEALPEGAFVLSRIEQSGETFTHYYWSNAQNSVFAELAGRGAGSVRVVADDLEIVDSDIRAIAPDAANVLDPDVTPGWIDVDLHGDLTIRRVSSARDVGLLARGGIELFQTSIVDGEEIQGGRASFTLPAGRVDRFFPGLSLDLASGREPGADIDVSAENVHLAGGAIISSTTFTSGDGGRVTLDVDDTITIEGFDPALGRSSGLFSNNQGDATARGGDIEIDARRLELRDRGGVFAPTFTDGDAGNVAIRVDELLVEGGSQIDGSTTGDPARGEPGQGDGGSIEIAARESIVLSGRIDDDTFSRISTFSRAASEGASGSIRIATPLLTIEDGAGIEVTTEGEGGGGDIELDVGRLRMERDARISARSEAVADPAGDITIASRRATEVRSGSRISARSQGLQGTGGRVTLRSDEVLVVEGVGAIEASAPLGQGGRIVVSANQLIASPEAFDASGGVDGEVVVESPDVALEAQVTPPPADYLDASSMLLAQCSARRTGERAGSFQVARAPGLPITASGPLLALDPIAVPTRLASTPEGLPAVAAGPEQASPSVPSPGPPVDGLPSQLGPSAETLIELAQLVRGGHTRDAEAGFSRLAVSSRGGLRADALRGEAQAQQLQGEFAASLDRLEEALAEARRSGDRMREAAAQAQLGNAWVALGDLERAANHLADAVAAARESAAPGLLASALNNLGNLHAIHADWIAADTAYQEAATRAAREGDALGAAQSLANAARARIEAGATADAFESLRRARRLSRDLGPDRAAISLRIHVAESFRRLAREPGMRREALRTAHRTLLDASGDALGNGDPRLASEVYGGLAELYLEEGGRSEEAIYLTRRALMLAERAEAYDLAARWQTRLGGIHRDRGDTDAAIASLTRAVDLLEALRPEVRASYGSREALFRRTIAPVHLALVDLLIQRSSDRADAPARDADLRAAVGAVERFRTAELRDYFRDECVEALEARARSVEEISPTAAVVHPILLPDRLELLVSHAGTIRRHPVEIDAETLTSTVASLRRQVVNATTFRYLRPARRLYDWLVRPYADELLARGVDTLVVVPDGPLRTIPWGVLHDGERHAIERFAIGLTPSLELIAPRPLDPSTTDILLAGVSESVGGADPLPNVATELTTIHALYGGDLLMDEAFVGDRFRERLREGSPGVVHIASHAEFTGDPRTSYVLTHDQRVSMEELSRMMEASRFADEPVELLILSACETAAGDERAALGLAGVAVRAGARSAIGGLWSVNDEASSELMIRFYRELGKPSVSKAEAMARAQRALIATRRMDHPFFWAGFIVINNWL